MYVGALENIQRQVLTATHLSIGFVLTPVEGPSPNSDHYSIIRIQPGPHCADLTGLRLPALAVHALLQRVAPRSTQSARSRRSLVVRFRGFVDCNAACPGGAHRQPCPPKEGQNQAVGQLRHAVLPRSRRGLRCPHRVQRPPAARANARASALWGETGLPVRCLAQLAKASSRVIRATGIAHPPGVVFNSWNGYTEVRPSRSTPPIPRGIHSSTGPISA